MQHVRCVIANKLHQQRHDRDCLGDQEMHERMYV